MQSTNETNEYNCVNCNSPLHQFVASERQGIYSYCMDVNCHYSSFYDSNYEIARRYFMEHDKNVGGFRFYDGEKVSEETPQPTVYNLDMSQIFGHESVKQTIIDVVNSEKVPATPDMPPKVIQRLLEDSEVDYLLMLCLCIKKDTM